MGSDYEQWKKRRERERAQRARDEEQAPRARREPQSDPSPSQSERASTAGAEPQRVYRDGVSLAPYPSVKPEQRGARGRGCLGCLGLLLGLLALLALGLLIGGTFYWRAIEQRGPVTVLVLGTDERKTEPGPFRSDTMILTGFNPNRREVALMSIPRDLWVTVPDVGENRVNTAHFFGGPELAKQTVADTFGVPLHYYLKLNFDGFVSIIDAMGGLTINVPEPLHDDQYPTPDYGYTTIDIPAGEQQMSGATALIYARTRHGSSDFDRGRRQQEVIAAIRNKLAQPRTWLRAPAIFAAARSAIQTDIPQGEWPALALILVRSNVQRAAIGPDDTQNFTTSGGAQVLLPIWERINPTLARYFE